MKIARSILPVIVIAQFCCTSIWFASNGVIDNLVQDFDLAQSALGHLTSAVQFGFILGTLSFAVLGIADRFSPSTVFFWSALAGALFNAGALWESNSLPSLLLFRFLTGFFLAGIYPVGMKIAADYYDQQLGKSLGFLVGALVLGTALPHLLKEVVGAYPWQYVLVATSILAGFGGGLILLLVPDGPYRKPSQRTDLAAFFQVFKVPNFRYSAYGYFGHMWELYTFWAFVPVMLIAFGKEYGLTHLNISVLSFIIIGAGGLACVLSGILSQAYGKHRIASGALLLSASCCLAFPLMFALGSEILFIGFLIFWGMVVIADSPLLSTLVAQNAPSASKGTALTIVNCIGFSITIVSIQVLSALIAQTDSKLIYLVLALGPALGLVAMWKKMRSA